MRTAVMSSEPRRESGRVPQVLGSLTEGLNPKPHTLTDHTRNLCQEAFDYLDPASEQSYEQQARTVAPQGQKDNTA